MDVAEIYGNALFTPSFPMFNYVNIQKVLQSEHSRVKVKRIEQVKQTIYFALGLFKGVGLIKKTTKFK